MIDSPFPSATDAASPQATDVLSACARFAGAPLAWWHPLPWSVRREGDALEVRLERLREEIVADPANREVILACGAVLENLRLAAYHGGRQLDIELWPEGTRSATVARVAAGGVVSPRCEEETLYALLERGSRVEVRQSGGAISPALLAVLRHAARSEGGWLDVIADDARRQIVGDLESEGAAIADAERGARRLLASRLEAPERAEFASGGEPALGELLAALGGRVNLAGEWSSGRSPVVRGRAVEAPLLVVLGANDDVPREWVRAGSALQRVLLHASVQGLSATFLNEPLLHPLLRDALRSVLFGGGAPQAIVRFDFVATAAQLVSLDTSAGRRDAPAA